MKEFCAIPTVRRLHAAMVVLVVFFMCMFLLFYIYVAA